MRNYQKPILFYNDILNAVKIKNVPDSRNTWISSYNIICLDRIKHYNVNDRYSRTGL